MPDSRWCGRDSNRYFPFSWDGFFAKNGKIYFNVFNEGQPKKRCWTYSCPAPRQLTCIKFIVGVLFINAGTNQHIINPLNITGLDSIALLTGLGHLYSTQPLPLP